MTKSTSPSADGAASPPFHNAEGAEAYESTVWMESKVRPGVQYEVLRMSLLRRHRMLQELKALVAEQRFHAAGEGLESSIAAAELRGRIDEIVIRRGLVRIAGLNIGGRAATVESLLEEGPEELAIEIAETIGNGCFLSEEERKN